MLEKRLFGVAGRKYLAGLWNTRILEDLSWTVLGIDSGTESIEDIPTWSWASTTSPTDYIYGKPSDTFIELVEARCTGYARPRETLASLRVKGFVAPLCLRVDHRQRDRGGRPSLSFWVNKGPAMTATEEIEAERKAARTTSCCVWDLPIWPASHDYAAIGETRRSRLPRVPSIVRESEKQGRCNIYSEKAYVSPLQLLLLTRTDMCLTALVLSPVSSRSLKVKGCNVQEVDEVYQRLGLFRIGRPGEEPWIETADGFQVPAEAFWELDIQSARRTITILEIPAQDSLDLEGRVALLLP